VGGWHGLLPSKNNEAIMNIADLTFDSKNANKGTERGSKVLETSLQQYGAGRSILIDKNGVIIAGNKTVETAGQLGMTNVKVVETTGSELVAVKRTDLDLTSDPEARELAYADNRVGQLSLDWDADELFDSIANGVDLSKFWSEKELDTLFNPNEQEYDENIADGLELRRVFEIECQNEKAAEFESRLNILLEDFPECILKKTERV
jgi:hypothetical protein